MHNTSRTLIVFAVLIVFAALNISAIGHSDEPAAVEAGGKADAPTSAPNPAWPTLLWKKGAPSPFARVESPAAA